MSSSLIEDIGRNKKMSDDVVPIRPRKGKPLKVGDKIFHSAYDWELTAKDLEKATRELSETEERKKVCLQKLKEKLSKESNIKYRIDDFYLLRFLRVRKYDVEKAYHNVKLFFGERRKHSDYFILPQKSAQELNLATILPYTNEEGEIMFWANLNKWNPAEKTFEEILQTVTTVWDIVSMNPHCHINGVVGISNLSGMSMRHVSETLWNGRLWALISFLQEYSTALRYMGGNQGLKCTGANRSDISVREIMTNIVPVHEIMSAYPWRIKKVIFLNTNRLVRLLYSIIRPLLQRKIAERIFLLGSDVNELHQHVNPILLPESLNGTLKEEACDISQHILDNLPYLKYERSFIF